jgi:hypothetical protein
MATAEPEQAQVSMGAAFCWMFFYVLLSTAAIVGLNHLMMPQRNGLALFGVWLLNLILILGLAGWFNGRTGGRGWMPILVIAYAVYSLAYGVMLGHIPRLFFLRESPLLSVHDAGHPPHDAYDVYHFSDGHVDLSQVARTTLRGRNGSVTYLVAPLVSEDWKRGDRITAWVGESSLDSLIPGSWAVNNRGGYRLGLDGTYEDLVKDRIRSRSLLASPTAPILQWSPDPKGGYLREGWIELGIFIAIGLVGLVSVLIPGRSSSR